MKKAGTLKLQRHRKKEQKQRPPAPLPRYPDESDSDASDGVTDMADMLDDAEREYMEQRLARQPQLLSNIPTNDENQTK